MPNQRHDQRTPGVNGITEPPSQGTEDQERESLFLFIPVGAPFCPCGKTRGQYWEVSFYFSALIGRQVVGHGLTGSVQGVGQANPMSG
jgi:hypothetical protein